MSSDGSVSIEELIARLEKAETGSTEIDRLLWEVVTGECTHPDTTWVKLKLECARCGEDAFAANHWRGSTTSLDAIVSLIERKQPAFLYRAEKLSPMRRIKEEIPHWASCGDAGEQESAYHRTAPLALCLAFLKALQAKGAQ